MPAHAERRWWVTAVLVGVPATLAAVVFATCRQVSPLWMGGSVDPSYAYLLNGLMVAEGRPPALALHPGTPLQVLVALVLHAVHGLSGSPLSLPEHVLRDPERFVSAVRAVLIGLIFLANVLQGLAAYRLTRSALCAAAVQLAPFVPAWSIRSQLLVMCEPLLLALAFGLSSCVLLALAHEPARPAGRPELWMGLCTGVAIATKLLAAPFSLAALAALPGWRRRLVFVAGTALTCGVALLPAWPRLPASATWVWSAFRHAGVYGAGPEGIVAPDAYRHALAVVAGREAYLVGIGLLGTVAAIAFRAPAPRAVRRCLWAVLAAGSSIFFVMVKYPGAVQYVVTAASLSGLALALAHRLTTLSIGESPRWLAALTAAVLATGAGVQAQGLHRWLRDRRPVLPGAAAAARAAAELGPGRILCGYSVSTVASALTMGNEWCGRAFSEDLRRLYPEALSFDWAGLHHFGRPVVVAELAGRLVDGDSLLVWDSAMGPHETWDFFRGLSVAPLGRYGRDRLLRARFAPLEADASPARSPRFAGLLILTLPTDRPAPGSSREETLAPLGPVARFAILGTGRPLRLAAEGRYEGVGVQTLRFTSDGRDIGTRTLRAGRWQAITVDLPPRTGLFELAVAYDRLFVNTVAQRPRFPGYAGGPADARWPAVRFRTLQVWRATVLP